MLLGSLLKNVARFLYHFIIPKNTIPEIIDTVKQSLWNPGFSGEINLVSKEDFEKYPTYYQHIIDSLNICSSMRQSTNNKKTAVNAFFITLQMLFIPYIIFKLPHPHEHWCMLICLAAIQMVMCLIWFGMLYSYWQYYIAVTFVSMEIQNRLSLNIFRATREVLQKTLNKGSEYISAVALETLIPWIFIIIYFILGIMLFSYNI